MTSINLSSLNYKNQNTAMAFKGNNPENQSSTEVQGRTSVQHPSKTDLENAPTWVVSPRIPDLPDQIDLTEGKERVVYYEPKQKGLNSSLVALAMIGLTALGAVGGSLGAYFALNNKTPVTQEQVQQQTPSTLQTQPGQMPTVIAAPQPSPPIVAQPEEQVTVTPEPIAQAPQENKRVQMPVITQPSSEARNDNVNISNMSYDVKTELLEAMWKGQVMDSRAYDEISRERALELKQKLNENPTIKNAILEASSQENIPPEFLAAIIYDSTRMDLNYQYSQGRTPLTLLTQRTADMVNNEYFKDNHQDPSTPEGSIRLAAALLSREILPAYSGSSQQYQLSVAAYKIGNETIRSQVPNPAAITNAFEQVDMNSEARQSMANVSATLYGLTLTGGGLF